jgi:hypothetical protein
MACVADPQAWFAPASRPFDITDRSTWSAINSEQVADLWLSQGAPSHLQPALQAIVDRASTNWPQQRHTASTPASHTSTIKSVASVQDSGSGLCPRDARHRKGREGHLAKVQQAASSAQAGLLRARAAPAGLAHRPLFGSCGAVTAGRIRLFFGAFFRKMLRSLIARSTLLGLRMSG